MHDVAMDQRGRQDPDQSRQRTRSDSQSSKVQSIKKFDAEDSPHDKCHAEGHDGTPEKCGAFGTHEDYICEGSVIMGSRISFISSSPTDFIPKTPPEDSAIFFAI